MADDYEDIYDIEDMDDGDLEEFVVQQIQELQDVDPDRLEIEVEDGHVVISGRVGTEQELQAVEQLLSDDIGLGDWTNGMVVDELVRAEYSEAADDAIAEAGEEAPDLGAGENETEPSASHLIEDDEADAFGTENLQKAIEEGKSYHPPDRPPQFGTRSEEDH